jgi:hypothetical protein
MKHLTFVFLLFSILSFSQDKIQPKCDQILGLEAQLLTPNYTGILKNCVDGKVMEIITLKNGIWDGQYYHYQEGKLKSTGKYREGLKDGVWYTAHDNGSLWYKQTYLLGVLNGEIYWYYRNEQLMYKGNYLNGKAEGQWRSYYITGQPQGIYHHHEGEKDGEWLFYNEDGSIQSYEIYSMGKLIEKIY